MHIKYFYIHLSISFKRSSNFNMDILKNKYTYNLDKNNSQENWNPSYVDKFNVSSSDADIKGNVCNLENFGIYRVNILKMYRKKEMFLIFYFRYFRFKILHES